MRAMAASTIRSLALGILFLAWVGFVSIGVSGVVAAGMQAAFGAGFLAGDFPGVTYTPDRCADLKEYAPSGATCEEAAALHHSDETVTYRLAAGVLGLLLLGVWFAARRQGTGPGGGLPAGMVPAAGAALFGVVGLALLAQGLELLALGPGTGAGADLSAGIVSLVVAALFGIALYQSLAARDAGSRIS
jgi:hypothetical protein